MKEIEIIEVSQLPSKYHPLSAWTYFGLSILYALPLIGQILLIVHALSDDNINRRSFARSYFCSLLIALFFGVIAILLFVVTGLL